LATQRPSERVERSIVDFRHTKLGISIASIERKLTSIKRDLERRQDDVRNVTGYRKEIDHAFKRIAAIEKHLGLKPKYAVK
jgi:hypothetical protein